MKEIWIETACEWIRERNRHACKEWLDKECEDFRRDMREKIEPTDSLSIVANVNGNEYHIGGKIDKLNFERVLDKCVKVITMAIKEKENWK